MAARVATFGLRWLLRRFFPEIEEGSLRLVRRVLTIVVYIAAAVVGFGLIGIDLSAVADAFRVLNYPLWGPIGKATYITLMTPVTVVLVWIVTGQVSRLLQRALAETATVRGVELEIFGSRRLATTSSGFNLNTWRAAAGVALRF